MSQQFLAARALVRVLPQDAPHEVLEFVGDIQICGELHELRDNFSELALVVDDEGYSSDDELVAEDADRPEISLLAVAPPKDLLRREVEGCAAEGRPEIVAAMHSPTEVA